MVAQFLRRQVDSGRNRRSGKLLPLTDDVVDVSRYQFSQRHSRLHLFAAHIVPMGILDGVAVDAGGPPRRQGLASMLLRTRVECSSQGIRCAAQSRWVAQRHWPPPIKPECQPWICQ
jgi:hypothetical protein